MSVSSDTANRVKYALTSAAARDEIIAILNAFTPNTAGTIQALSQLLAELPQNAITAFATGGQASATPIAAQVNRITTCATAGDSVLLPASTPGLTITIVNDGATGCDVFGQTGDTLNSLAANVAFRLAVGSTLALRCYVAGAWRFSTSAGAPAKYVKNTTAGATTAAAGDMTGAAYVSAEYSAVGAAALTTRTAAQLFADQPNAQPGDSYTLEITNTSGGTTTLTAGTGVTLTGTMTMATNTTRRFNVKIVDATHVTIQSVGVGTIS